MDMLALIPAKNLLKTFRSPNRLSKPLVRTLRGRAGRCEANAGKGDQGEERGWEVLFHVVHGQFP
jgi:hypothetical protein